MAKRTAERQLTKDDAEEIVEDDEGQRGIKVADKATLAARPMRGLPKRLGGSSSSTNVGSMPQAEPTSKFGSFSGFGTGSAAIFNFTPPASPGSSLNNSPAPKLDASWKSTPLTPPSFSSPPSKTAQTLASLIASPTIAEPTGPSPSAKTYFMSLRGLNNSFLKALNTALDDDPFRDLSASFFETYKKYLLIIDTQRKTAEAEEERAKAPTTTFSKSFGAASSSPPKANAQTAASTKQSPFSFPSPGASDPSKAFNFNSKPAASSGSGFSFPPSSGTNSKLAPSPFGSAAPAAAATPSPFTPAPSAATTSLFGLSSSSPFGATATAKPSTSLFGAPTTSSSTDATISSSSKLTFGNSELAASEKPSPFGAPAGSSSTFSFGGPATKEPTASSSFGSPAGGSPFSFGAKKDTTTTAEPMPNFFSTPPAASSGGPLSTFGGFGKPSTPGGNIGNPVGFGFGAAAEAAKKAADEKGADEKVSAEDEIEMTPTEPSSSQELAKEKSGLNFDTPHDVEGEGEEDESTTYSLKIKAYRLKKGESAGWADLGTGVLRLKKHVTTDARRVLMRNSASGKININFRLYAGFKPTVSKKALTFMGHDETGAATTYSVRTKTEDQAGQLKDALEREIAFVKAKEAGA